MTFFRVSIFERKKISSRHIFITNLKHVSTRFLSFDPQTPLESPLSTDSRSEKRQYLFYFSKHGIIRFDIRNGWVDDRRGRKSRNTPTTSIASERVCNFVIRTIRHRGIEMKVRVTRRTGAVVAVKLSRALRRIAYCCRTNRRRLSHRNVVAPCYQTISRAGTTTGGHRTALHCTPETVRPPTT